MDYFLILNVLIVNILMRGGLKASKDYIKQKKGLICCPSCESKSIKKALMAPNLNKKSNSKNNNIKRSVATNISKLKKIVEKNFDYVGDRFSEEAKKIKYR